MAQIPSRGSLILPPRWMGCYVLLGLVQSGLIPIILPLAAAPGPTSGLTYGAFAAAGILAPFVGAWSDHHRHHRWTLTGGLLLASIGLLLHTQPGGLAQHMATAALIGFGVSSASTVGTMFIVEVEPEARWDAQIGVLQACIGGGQLMGLLLAGGLGLHHVQAAFLSGAALLLAAAPLALLTAPHPVTKVPRPSLPAQPAHGGDAAATGPARALHRVTLRAIRGLGHSPLAVFLTAWLLSYTATNGLSVMISVATVRGYGAPALWPTTAYAVGVGLSLFTYRRVARWDTRAGPWRLLTTGLTLRAVLVGAMAVMAGVWGAPAVIPILLAFGGTQLIWPLLSVASNTLAVTLSPAHRAESVGLLNAVTSIGATVGGVIGGVLLRQGFMWLCVTVLLALLLAIVLVWHPRVRPAASGQTLSAAG